MYGYLFGLLGAFADAESIDAVPVQRLSYPCTTLGFPLVLEDGVLGCSRAGQPTLWWNAERDQVSELPAVQWIVGDALYAIGQKGGSWSLMNSDWSTPKRRVLTEVSEGSARIQEGHVVWVTEKQVHVLDLDSGHTRDHSALPVLSQAPVWFGDSVYWIEWGESAGIHSWNPITDAEHHISSNLATQLWSNYTGLYWIDLIGVQCWNPDVEQVMLVQAGLIQDLWVNDTHTCWTLVEDGELDVWCDGVQWSRPGAQRHPRYYPWGKTFVENGQLMKVVE